MLIKIFILIALLSIVVSLGSGMFYLIRDKSGSKRTVNALTLRIALSVALFALLFVAWALGYIQPHGMQPGS